MAPKASVPPPRPERPAFELGDQAIAAGSLEHLELPVARLPTGTQLSLPVAVAHGVEPGPVVWVSSTIHGDELNGLAVIRSVLRQLNPRALRGTLIAVSVVNVFGIINASRYLPDRRDLNRSFPARHEARSLHSSLTSSSSKSRGAPTSASTSTLAPMVARTCRRSVATSRIPRPDVWRGRSARQ